MIIKEEEAEEEEKEGVALEMPRTSARREGKGEETPRDALDPRVRRRRQSCYSK